MIASVGQASAALSYTEDFESLSPADAAALSGTGWLIGNVIQAGGTGAWFGPNNGAPNTSAGGGLNGYSAVVTGQGGATQGTNQLSVFSDYNGWSAFGGAGSQTLDTFVYRDLGLVTADMVGQTYEFTYDTKEGNISSGPTAEAYAYITVLKSSDNSFGTIFNDETDTENGIDWNRGTVSVAVDAGMVGELMQIGFRNRTTEWEASGVFYDNLSFSVSAVPEPSSLSILAVSASGLLVRRRRA